MPTEQQLQVAQGALFLIDNTPDCPQDMERCTLTDATITRYLVRPTYTYQAHADSGREYTTEVTI
jgi:hypothetical protein